MDDSKRYLWLRANCSQEILSDVFGVVVTSVRSQETVGRLLDNTIDEQIERDAEDA